MKPRKGSLTEIILIALEKTVDGYIRLQDFTYNPARYVYGDPSSLKKSNLSQAIKRLRQKGLIQESLKDSELVIKLTTLGKSLIQPNLLPEQEWDGIWRIVLFDIPEEKRLVRDLLRRRLRSWGFYPWQQSVWITKNNVTDRLRNLIVKLNIPDWVVIIESNDHMINNIMFNGR